jgi:hypothetical protein
LASEWAARMLLLGAWGVMACLLGPAARRYLSKGAYEWVECLFMRDVSLPPGAWRR